MAINSMEAKRKEDIKKIQNIELNILKEFARVCDENNLHYYLACGTCLGAVRHKGFIPWDDDVDVYMYYEDFEKLKKLGSQFPERYFLQCKETEPNFETTIIRIRDIKTTCFEKDEVGLDIHHGFFIDVYPLYFYPENKIAAFNNCMLSYLFRVLCGGRPPYNHGEAAKLISNVLLFMFKGNRRDKTIQAIKNRLESFKNTKYLVTYYGLDIHFSSVIAYNKEWFQAPSVLKFEDINFCGPTMPDKYLEKKFGNYMELPPVDKQVPHHSFVFANTEKPYTDYKGIYY